MLDKEQVDSSRSRSYKLAELGEIFEQTVKPATRSQNPELYRLHPVGDLPPTLPPVRELAEQIVPTTAETDEKDPEQLKYARPASALNSEILTSSAAARYSLPASHYLDWKPEYKQSEFALLSRENRSISIDSLSTSQEIADESRIALPELKPASSRKPELKKKSIAGRTAYLWKRLVAATKAKEFRISRLSVSLEEKATHAQVTDFEHFEQNRSESNRELPSAPIDPIDAESEIANTDTTDLPTVRTRNPSSHPCTIRTLPVKLRYRPPTKSNSSREATTKESLQEIDTPLAADIRSAELSPREGIKSLVWDSTDLDITFEQIEAGQLIKYPDNCPNLEELEANVDSKRG